MKVYVVAKCDDYDVNILGVFKNEKDAEKCFADYVLECCDDEDMTDEEKEGIKNWNYWSGNYRLIISEKMVK